MGNSGPSPRRIFGETEWLTYGEVHRDARAFGVALRKLGLVPAMPGSNLDSKPHAILIFEDTSRYWLTALLGASSQSIVVATSYATLGISSVAEAIKECNVSVVVCNRKKVQEVSKTAQGTSLRTIIYTDHYCAPNELLPVAPSNGMKVMSFDEAIAEGEPSLHEIPETPTSAETLAVIMYTSGSTGKPKGVMITNGNVAASVAGLSSALYMKKGKETYCAHLPAAHIFEFCVELVMLSVGAAIGFADPKTLSSAGAVRQREDGSLNEAAGYPYPPGAVQEFRPSLLVAVPIIWDTFKKKVEEEVGKRGIISKTIVQAAYSAKYWARKSYRTCPLFHLLVFRKFSQMLGGRLNLAASGGGPLNADVQNFISIMFGCNLLQGYALTETTCAGTAQRPEDPDTGTVGGPISSVEMKLLSCDGPEDPRDHDGNQYLAEDTDHYGTTCQGRGEVCIRGPSLSKGYFKQPDKTREVFAADGWFHTGDIGYWDTRGRLVIVDRLKNLVKLKGGEYIAIENMEKEYSTSPFVDGVKGGIMCYGDGDMRRPGALVQVNLSELKKWARGQNLPDNDVEALCANPKAQEAVLKSLKEKGKHSLGANEIVVAVGLIPGTGPPEEATATSPWTPDNGCRTASNKLDRKAIQKTYAKLMADIKKAGA